MAISESDSAPEGQLYHVWLNSLHQSCATKFGSESFHDTDVALSRRHSDTRHRPVYYPSSLLDTAWAQITWLVDVPTRPP